MSRTLKPVLTAVYKPLLLFVASLLLALSLFRMLLIAMHWSRVDAVDGLLFVLIQGVRFDLIITSALVLPVAILSPFLCHRPAWLKALKYYLLAALSHTAAASRQRRCRRNTGTNFANWQYPKTEGLQLTGWQLSTRSTGDINLNAHTRL